MCVFCLVGCVKLCNIYVGEYYNNVDTVIMRNTYIEILVVIFVLQFIKMSPMSCSNFRLIYKIGSITFKF